MVLSFRFACIDHTLAGFQPFLRHKNLFRQLSGSSNREHMRTKVGNSILWGLSRRNSKFIINDAQPLSFQVVIHSSPNTCMLALSRSSIFLTGISGQGCTLHSRVCQSTVLNIGLNRGLRINVFPISVQTDVGSDDELRFLP